MQISRQHSALSLFLLFLSAEILSLTDAQVGSAAHYSPPYLPTKCYGGDPSPFPTNNFFAAAGEGLWDNGAACGRQYQIRCLSTVDLKNCVKDKSIVIKVVDFASLTDPRPSRRGANLVLSNTAFAAIANLSVPYVNIEFQPV